VWRLEPFPSISRSIPTITARRMEEPPRGWAQGGSLVARSESEEVSENRATCYSSTRCTGLLEVLLL